ncbi:MAG: insulinase family protein [Nitrospirales bacterium]|nr:insulinase family protein [Nitrospirales bacterium]
MCKKLRYAIVFVLLLLPSLLFAQTKEYVLKNGLKVLVVEDHKAPLATFQIWYRVGAKDEPVGKTGMSHLLEHMMFKGTPKYGSKVFSAIVQRNGGSDNAFTTKDYTMYFQTIASDRIGLSIEMEADRMENLLLKPEDFQSERAVVMEERRMRYEDDPENSLYEEVIATSFKAHPYRWPVIGWMSDIAALKRDDFVTHYKEHYAPSNAFIVISGDVDGDSIIKKIEESFGRIPEGKRTEGYRTEEPVQEGRKVVYLEKEAELPMVMMAYHVPQFPHDDSFALDLLSSILSSGKSSRLYTHIVRDSGLAISAEADYGGLYRDPFLFTFSAAAAPGKGIAEVKEAIAQEIERVKAEPPSEEEIQKAKNQVEASFIFAEDSTYSRGLYTGIFEMMGDWRLMDKYLEGIRKVTPEDVRRVAKKYLTEENVTVGILKPVKKESGNAK